jgi:4-amino-4-deoxy-L-arabinose transferase-like glycosyltransferase
VHAQPRSNQPHIAISSSVPIGARSDWVFWIILALALLLRLYRIDAPYVDAHSWRQVTNADIARLWVEHPLNIFYPQVSWGGRDGYVGSEFPLIQALAAIAWRVFGYSDAAGRLVAVAFSVASVWLMYLLGTRLFGRPAGRGAALLLAFAPSYVYFGRTLLSDVPMMCFSIGAVLGYVKYFFGGERRSDVVMGAICLALAGLVKIPAVLILGPVIWMAWLAHRWRLFNDAWFAASLSAAIGVIGLWYLHADRIYLETGLTQAIFRPSNAYTYPIAAFSGPFVTNFHWTRLADDNVQTLRVLIHRLWALHLTPIGSIGALVGLLRFWAPSRRTIVDIWMLAALALVAVSLPGQFNHEFHQLPLLAPLALYFGMAVAPLFDLERLGSWARPGAVRAAVRLGVVGAWIFVAYFAFARSPVFMTLYRPSRMNLALVDAGRAIDAAVPADALLVTVEFARMGTNSPLLLYYAHRRGWSFDTTAMLPMTIDYLRDSQGACYFATSDWTVLGQTRPEVVVHLRSFRIVPLPGVNPEYRLFDLGCAR